MKRMYIFLITIIPFLSLKGQDTYSIINELRNTFKNYQIETPGGPVGNRHKSNQDEVRISYVEPIITIQLISEYYASPCRYIDELKISFDVLKTRFYDSSMYSYQTGVLNINCPSGIDVFERRQSICPFTPNDKSTRNLKEKYLLYAERPIVTRLVNAFNNLQAIAKEKGVKKSNPNILDNAELVVEKFSFVAPDNSGKLKANQTGCFKIEIKNATSNNAFNVACVVREKNKSELFSYEQYTSIEKISGNNTEVINIPIKASENVDNGTYPFEIMITYNGKTIKTETLNIIASNPKKQQSASSASTSTRNKVIRMRKMAGNTYFISCKVNGLPLDFIFDTGASSVTLSRKQAVFMLKNGYLSKSDIVGSSAYQTASGDIAIGTVIKLKKIEINGLVLNNVEASIINSDSAPLLLGQSALSRLGKIQIDYNNSTLTIIR